MHLQLGRTAPRILAAGVLGLSGVVSVNAPARAGTAVVVIDGRGFGHGVDMAQDGTLTMGRSGSTIDRASR